MIKQPFEVNGNQLGMSLTGFKAKNRRKVAISNRPAPWCDEESATGLVHCRVAFSSMRPDGKPTSTVVGVPTEQLLYSFVENRLFKISADFDSDFTEKIRAALIARYGSLTIGRRKTGLGTTASLRSMFPKSMMKT